MKSKYDLILLRNTHTHTHTHTHRVSQKINKRQIVIGAMTETRDKETDIQLRAKPQGKAYLYHVQ